MKKRLVEVLRCPRCKGKLSLTAEKLKGGEIESGSLLCTCGARYNIIEGVPVMLVDKLLKRFGKTKKNWQNWWKKVRTDDDILFYDTLWVKAEKNLGGEPLYRKKDFKGKVVLDAGCGSGRYINSDFSKFGCKEIFGVDLGEQVFMAKRQNNAANTHFVQCDITNMPFPDGFFDVVASHGVLHHTPEPSKTFAHLSTKLKTGGLMAIYVYHKEWVYFRTHAKNLFLDFLYAGGVMVWLSIRKLVSMLPHPLIMLWVYFMAIKSTISTTLERTNLFRPLGALIRLLPPFAYLGVNFHERVVRNYDHYSATYNYFHTSEEVEAWFRENAFDDITFASVPLSVRGYKQSKPPKALTEERFPFIKHEDFRKEWERLYARSKR